MTLFGDQFSRKSGKRFKKMPNMKGINTYGTFWGSIFKKIRKTAVALCGAIFWTLENDEKMPNMKGINTYGTFWRSIFKKIRKTIKKMPNMKGINTYGTFG